MNNPFEAITGPLALLLSWMQALTLPPALWLLLALLGVLLTSPWWLVPLLVPRRPRDLRRRREGRDW